MDQNAALVEIIALERLPMTASGNPRFRVTLRGGTVFETKPDGQTNHEIENLFELDRPVVIRVEKGYIVDVQVP